MEKGVIHQEEVMNFLVESMSKNPEAFRVYGYDLYVIQAARKFVSEIEKNIDHIASEQRVNEISGVFFDVAWGLCQRGIVRPGVRSYHQQATDDGSAGNGFSLTSYGRLWLVSEERNLYVPTELDRFAQILDKHNIRFGTGFRQRSQEALKCYSANAYLASCAMCGAAAESILLSVAFAIKDEEFILKEYRSSNGRKKIENLILKGKDNLRNELEVRMSLLKYWRDDASHGAITPILNEEAFVSLATLLRLAQWVDDNWNALTI